MPGHKHVLSNLKSIINVSRCPQINESVKRKAFISKDSTEFTLFTEIHEPEEQRNVATCGIPDTFIPPQVEGRDIDQNRSFKRIRGLFVGTLFELDPICKKFYEKKSFTMLYVDIMNSIYVLPVLEMLL